MAAIGLMMATSVNAQKILNESTTPFEESKFYIGASLSGLTLNYSKASDWSFGLSAKAGYLLTTGWLWVSLTIRTIRVVLLPRRTSVLVPAIISSAMVCFWVLLPSMLILPVSMSLSRRSMWAMLSSLVIM